MIAKMKHKLQKQPFNTSGCCSLAVKWGIMRGHHVPRKTMLKILLLLLLQYGVLVFLTRNYLVTHHRVGRNGSLYAITATDITAGKGKLGSQYIARTPPGRALLPLCPAVPPNLTGPIPVSVDCPSMVQMETAHPELAEGGRWSPTNCRSRHRMALIIPYRDRIQHLRTFLHNIHPFLQKQQLDYGIFVVEQANSSSKFNRAMLMNIGFREALKLYDYQCFVYHDVDLLPEDDRNLYNCPDRPRHMSGAVDKFGYRLPYDNIFGGVSAMRREHFETVNGFSNMFFGWGGEDDDLFNRLKFHDLRISRYPMRISRYKMLEHAQDMPNPDRMKYLFSGKLRYKVDGINSMEYKLVNLKKFKLYTWIVVELDEELVVGNFLKKMEQYISTNMSSLLSAIKENEDG